MLQAKDDLGEMVSLAKPPQRIVCLSPNAVEIAFALGLGERVVGVSAFSDYPPEAKEKPVVGRYDRPSIEKIASVNPDLVLLGYGNPKEIIPVLRNLEIPLFGINPKSIEDIIEVMERVGAVCGVEAEAKQAAANLRTRLEKARERLPVDNQRRVRVFVIIDEESLWTVGADTLQDQILRLAGGDNIASFRHSYFPISKERLFEAQPEVILATGDPTQEEVIRRRLSARADLSALPAVRQGNIVVVDEDIYSRPGPRVVDAVEHLSQLLSKFPSKQSAPPHED
ncbi:MAG: ABC transporter substrate-binding protein [Armatimonadetes bacterium]|nr:ABC transporter substrate-binding protein [Armatimonadota bacterium]NIM24174.1 ABC transporter substrate-binding protein [Armatimonadota bacterium]NIM68033.1 ABC transporter substrate-binding protein [Armatimonadota bacterium]NIM76528.1 ABC transporter substrate-binding protein [Armatimonadota bacterium]NIN06267.1 ABC transporter substrate-binding protein [Armatimonadota bacterium]